MAMNTDVGPRGGQHRLISAGGASLRTHWNAGEARKAIQEKQYDCVVLQEQSTLPVKNAKRMHENVRLFDEEIKAAGSTTVLYMTWARLSAPESQQAITDAYAGIGRELGATVVPVGLAAPPPPTRPAGPARQGPEPPHPGRVVPGRVRLPRRAVPGEPRRGRRRDRRPE